MDMPGTFDQKNVLVTGGTRGIGRDIVKRFSEAGARVAFTFRSSTAEADALVSELGAENAMAIQGDAAEVSAANDAVGAVMEKWGSLDVLVNNAGVTRDNLMLRATEEDWDIVLNTNLKSVFNFCKAVYRPMMKQRSGRIINISSVVGVTGNAGQTNYAASKAGMIGLSKSLAKELAKRGVTVNVVAPGYIATDMTADVSDAARDAMLGMVPVGRAGDSADVSAAVLFLASEGASYITGQVLHVDGGMAM
jgi:3-oxoacyl-[acyl-carrier protein] reductase